MSHPIQHDSSNPASWKHSLQLALRTDSSKSLLLQRAVLGAVVLPHGLQKAFGWFGGFGYEATLAWFDSALSVPAALATLVVLSDLVGSLMLIAGVFTRLAALGTTLTMLGAIFMVHGQNGFFMNWFGTQPGEGYQFHLLALALGIPLLLRGGGAFAVDAWLSRSRWFERPTTHRSAPLEPARAAR